jgi:hypothetical protein
MLLPRHLFRWLFVLALLWGQTAAYAHTLSHLKDHDSGVPAHACELCMAQADLGSAATPTPPALHLSAATFDWFLATSFPAPAFRLVAPRARAPPVSR